MYAPDNFSTATTGTTSVDNPPPSQQFVSRKLVGAPQESEGNVGVGSAPYRLPESKNPLKSHLTTDSIAKEPSTVVKNMPQALNRLDDAGRRERETGGGGGGDVNMGRASDPGGTTIGQWQSRGDERGGMEEDGEQWRGLQPQDATKTESRHHHVAREGFTVTSIQRRQTQEGKVREYEDQVLELRQQLEAVVKERDALQSNQERVSAQWEGKVRRLQNQLKTLQGDEGEEVCT